MTRVRLTILLMFSLCSALSVFWGFALERAAKGIIVDFKVVYYGARCLLQHNDPYDEAQLMSVYLTQGGRRPADAVEANKTRQVVALQVYFPTAFLYLAPFALLPPGLAHLLWAALTVAAFTLASFLMWTLAQDHAPGASFYLTCFLLANCGILFAGGNPAGLAVALCVIATWCFLENKFVYFAIICFAVSLTLKPHDTGPVWLYFLFAGGICRKRALQTLAVTAAMAIPALLWIQSVSPHWMHELMGNLAATSVRGGITDPGPNSLSGSGGGMIIDLQTVFSVFRDDPRFYNPTTYLICGVLAIVWIVITLRTPSSRRMHYVGLAAIAALAMLPLYHRPHDAKLLILTLPACAVLFNEGGVTGWMALLLNSAAITLTSDFPLAILAQATKGMNFSTANFGDQMKMILAGRPMPLALLALAVFYLCMYGRVLRKDAISSVRTRPTLVRAGHS